MKNSSPGPNNFKSQSSFSTVGAKKCMVCDEIIEITLDTEHDIFGICDNCVLRLEYDELSIDDIISKH